LVTSAIAYILLSKIVKKWYLVIFKPLWYIPQLFKNN
jgi:hypothetical protein